MITRTNHFFKTSSTIHFNFVQQLLTFSTMKLAILTTLIATASADGHNTCAKGCAADTCDGLGKIANREMYDNVVSANKGAVDSGANSLHMGKEEFRNYSQPIAKHVPFVCKVKKTRRERELAAHVQMTLRVAVTGTQGPSADGMKVLHPMMEAHWIDYITVVDTSRSSHEVRTSPLPAMSLTRLMYVAGNDGKTTEGTSACFEFDLLKDTTGNNPTTTIQVSKATQENCHCNYP